MSDDVRARAEAWAASEVDAYPGGTLDERIRSWMHGGVHPDDVARFVVDGYVAGHRAALAAEAADASASPVDATAVAPATAQPVAWAVFAEDASVPAYVSASRNRADQVVDSEAGRIEGYRLVPLYAAPPATGDAAAVRLLRTLRGWLDVNERAWREAEVGCPTLIANVDAFLDALPRPAPATAVEDARKAFYEAAREWFALDRAAKTPPFPRAGQVEWSRVWANLSDTYDALLAAEAAATHAAKESRSDDRPAKGQGGV